MHIGSVMRKPPPWRDPEFPDVDPRSAPSGLMGLPFLNDLQRQRGLPPRVFSIPPGPFAAVQARPISTRGIGAACAASISGPMSYPELLEPLQLRYSAAKSYASAAAGSPDMRSPAPTNAPLRRPSHSRRSQRSQSGCSPSCPAGATTCGPMATSPSGGVVWAVSCRGYRIATTLPARWYRDGPVIWRMVLTAALRRDGREKSENAHMSKPVFEDLFRFSGRRNRKSYFLSSLCFLVVLLVEWGLDFRFDSGGTRHIVQWVMWGLAFRLSDSEAMEHICPRVFFSHSINLRSQ